MHVANLLPNRWVTRVLFGNPTGARKPKYPRLDKQTCGTHAVSTVGPLAWPSLGSGVVDAIDDGFAKLCSTR